MTTMLAHGVPIHLRNKPSLAWPSKLVIVPIVEAILKMGLHVTFTATILDKGNADTPPLVALWTESLMATTPETLTCAGGSARPAPFVANFPVCLQQHFDDEIFPSMVVLVEFIPFAFNASPCTE